MQYAESMIGTPYVWGGESPSGFDCSGLVQAAYAQAGIQLPRTAQQQYDATQHLPAGTRLQPGDLVFFGGPKNVEHVGIVDGDGVMVDAPHTGALVRRESYRWPTLFAASRPSSSSIAAPGVAA